MTKYGYARVSTQGQDLQAQIDQLKAEGCEVIYSEKFTGTTTERPEFDKLLASLNEGDTLVVTKMDRFARSATKGSDLVQTLLDRGIKVHILNIGLLDNTSASTLVRNIFFAFAQFERDMIVERLNEGKAVAKQREGYREGRKPTYTKQQLDHAMKLKEIHSFTQVAELTGISIATLKRESAKRKANEAIND
ncbi:recombinase family protein [Lysinibacillus sp. fkY74-1]|jgi:DNA invertase Pin-like site-specific DNA recombinase|uniref:recombinase family protein n=1 Tax=Lysinibacillus TaxID=400634 RepID=UPI0004D35F0F|nr:MULTISPECIES: recombinase family protein [Lysinibacillus]AJK86307.1 resolvase [Lysinibacillus fusiformis]KHK48549.1 resolvase [Lysinibacillus sp. A1]